VTKFPSGFSAEIAEAFLTTESSALASGSVGAMIAPYPL